ncbi:flavin reductase family protein [Arthrobacter ruber]|uniref:flavin reductase family protein n=1 Tax=Arthrobacter ruber TaxID=1258893 RepID=UPI001472A295|nr:flavin reductase family protein [Arthrobacter ruber]
MQDAVKDSTVQQSSTGVNAAIVRAEIGEPTAQAMRRVTGAFPTGISLVAAIVDGHPVGLLANSFTSVSLDPPLVSVNVALTSTTWPALRNATRWGISILSAGHADKVRMLSRPSAERFTDIDWYQTEDGAVLLTGSSATFQVSLETEVHAGDHALALLRVHGLHRDMDANPLVFYGSQLRQLAA